MKYIILILILIIPFVHCIIIKPHEMVELDNTCFTLNCVALIRSSRGDVIHVMTGEMGKELSFPCYEGIILQNPNNFTIGVTFDRFFDFIRALEIMGYVAIFTIGMAACGVALKFILSRVLEMQERLPS